MNCIQLIGRLSKDPEAITTSNSKSLVKFTIAVDAGKTSNGDRGVYFIPCHAWDKTGELITKFFHKGDRIGLAGKLEVNNVKGEDGKSKTYFSINVNNIDFIQDKKETTPSPEPQAEPPKEATPFETMAKEPDNSPYELPEIPDGIEELPFDV